MRITSFLRSFFGSSTVENSPAISEVTFLCTNIFMKFAAGIIKNHVSDLTLLRSVTAPSKDVLMGTGLRRIWKEIVVA